MTATSLGENDEALTCPANGLRVSRCNVDDAILGSELGVEDPLGRPPSVVAMGVDRLRLDVATNDDDDSLLETDAMQGDSKPLLENTKHAVSTVSSFSQLRTKTKPSTRFPSASTRIFGRLTLSPIALTPIRVVVVHFSCGSITDTNARGCPFSHLVPTISYSPASFTKPRAAALTKARSGTSRLISKRLP